MTDPSMMLLDEPFAGINPALIDKLILKLMELRERGIALAVVEHNMYAVQAICDLVYVMDNGSILASGTAEVVRNNPLVLAAYLGGERIERRTRG